MTVSLEMRRPSDTVTSHVMAMLLVTDGATNNGDAVSAPTSVTSGPAIGFHEYVMAWPSPLVLGSLYLERTTSPGMGFNVFW